MLRYKNEKKLFLTIQLSAEFDFSHQTLKLGIFDHQAIKIVYI